MSVSIKHFSLRKEGNIYICWKCSNKNKVFFLEKTSIRSIAEHIKEENKFYQKEKELMTSFLYRNHWLEENGKFHINTRRQEILTPFTRDLDQIGSLSIRILLDPIPEMTMRLRGIQSRTIFVYTGTDPDKFNRLRACAFQKLAHI